LGVVWGDKESPWGDISGDNMMVVKFTCCFSSSSSPMAVSEEVLGRCCTVRSVRCGGTEAAEAAETAKTAEAAVAAVAALTAFAALAALAALAEGYFK
jgi:hypothetical protein